MFADEFLPTDDISGSVQAAAVETRNALMDVGPIDVGRANVLVGVLGAMRMLPALPPRPLHGERPPAPERRQLGDTALLPVDEDGCVLLGAVALP